MQVKEGELVCVLGPSGCGKSTLLWSMAGLHGLTRGKVMLDEQSIVKPHPQIAMVFQEANLLPWRNLIRNIELPFELKNLSPSKFRARIDALLKKVGLTGFENKYPRELSGGMQQRASIVRSLAVDPSVLADGRAVRRPRRLHPRRDEPVIQQIWMETGKTIVFITHNIAEAIFLADRIFVMSPRPGPPVAHLRDRLPAAAQALAQYYARLHRGSSARSRDRSSMAAGIKPSTSSDRGSLPMTDNLLRDKIPTFDRRETSRAAMFSLSNWSALTLEPRRQDLVRDHRHCSGGRGRHRWNRALDIFLQSAAIHLPAPPAHRAVHDRGFPGAVAAHCSHRERTGERLRHRGDHRDGGWRR